MIDTKNQNTAKEKNYALSNFCGFLILLAICCFYFESLGITLIHSSSTAEGQIGSDTKYISLSNLVVQMFIFFLVFTFADKAEKYTLNNDTKGLIKHYAIRYLAIAAIGLIITAIENILTGNRTFVFNTFTAIGISGLYSLFFIALKGKLKLIIGASLIFGYQFILFIPASLKYVLGTNFGGFLGAIIFCGYILIINFLSEVYKKGTAQFVAWIMVFVGLFLLFFFIDILIAAIRPQINFFSSSKDRLSIFYFIICLLISSVTFILFAQFTQNKKIPILNWYGANGFIMFIFADVIVRALAILTKHIAPVDNNNWFYQVFPIGIVIVSAISIALAYFLYKFKITDKITKNNFCLSL